MADPMNGPNTRCPWCSAPLPDPVVETCPVCKATLVGTPGADADIKGVTTLDTEAILRARSVVARPRSGILSFITGDVSSDAGESSASPESLAPPAAEVRREMLRLRMEAERADLTAETVALKADALARRGIHVSQMADAEVTPDSDAEPDAGGAAPAPADAVPADAAAEPSVAVEAAAAWPAELDPDAAPAEPELPRPS